MIKKKNLSKLGSEENFLNLMKNCYRKKTPANIAFNGEKRGAFPLGSRKEVPLSPPPPFQLRTGRSGYCNNARKGNERHADWKEGHKTVFVRRCPDHLRRKPERNSKIKTPGTNKQL